MKNENLSSKKLNQTLVNESQKVTSKKAQTWIQFHRLIGVILNQSTMMFQGSCLAGHLRKSVPRSLFFTWFWVSQPCRWKYFGVGLSDQILAALVFVTSTEDNQCPHCPYAVSSSLLSNRASFPLHTFTPPEIHIWTPPKPTVQMTSKGRPVIDKILHNDRAAWNQVLLTCCNVSRKHWWDELEEAMGNTANFEGGTLYALQSLLTICGVFEKTKMKPCLQSHN